MEAPVESLAKKSTSVYRRLLLPVYLPAFFLVLINSACLLLLPLYLLQQGADLTTAAMALTMRGVGILFVDGPAGVAANRFGDKLLMLIGAICTFFSMLLLTLSNDMLLVLSAAFLLGMSNGMSMQGRLSYITDLTENYERGRAIALLAGLQRFGSIFSPLMFSYLATTVGFSFVFGTMAVLALSNLILVKSCVKALHMPHRRAAPMSGVFRLVKEYRSIFLTAGIAGFVLMLLRTGRQSIFPLAGAALGLDVVTIAWIFSASMALDTLLFYPAGIVMDRRGRKSATVPGMCLLSLSLLSLTVFPDVIGLWLFALLSGLGNGLTSGILLTLASDLAPDAQRNQFIGIWRMQTDLGVVTSPSIVGNLIESMSIGATTLVLAIAGLGGTALLAFTVKETLQRDPLAL